MTLLLLMVPLALADEPHIVPVAPGQTVTAETQSYLLPETKYDACLVNTLTLRGVEGALQTCVATGTDGLEQSQVALELAHRELEATQTDLVKLGATLQLRESELQQARAQRNVAWGVAGGLVLGSATALAVVLGRE